MTKLYRITRTNLVASHLRVQQFSIDENDEYIEMCGEIDGLAKIEIDMVVLKKAVSKPPCSNFENVEFSNAVQRFAGRANCTRTVQLCKQRLESAEYHVFLVLLKKYINILL